MIAQLDNIVVRLRPLRALTRLISYAFFEGRPLTTRGRWFNIFVFVFLQALRFTPFPGKTVSPVFIIGTGRSGTTVLGQILGVHKNIGFLNEPKAIWTLINSEEDLVGNYSKKHARYRLMPEDVTPRALKTAHRLYGWYRFLTFCRQPLDKYPELVFRVPYVKQIFPKAKFIFLVRNGWDTSYSIDRWSGQHQHEKNLEVHDWWGRDQCKWNYLVDQVAVQDNRLKEHIDELRALSDHKHMALVEWLLSMYEGLKMQAAFPNSILQVRYEDLAADPKTILMTVQNFCSVEYDPVVVSYASQILRPAPKHPNFKIPNYLKEYFEDMMIRLGYGLKS